MQLLSSNHRSAPRNGVSSLRDSTSVVSAVQKPAPAEKNLLVILSCEPLVPVPSISLSKLRLSKKSFESTYRMSRLTNPLPRSLSLTFSHKSHPYNPFKSLTHPYPDCPAGHVTLTRAAVLALSGWSNTQFSYWARRAEAICVLAPHDKTLYQVAVALDRRLRPLVSAPRYDAPDSAYPSPVSSLSSLTPTSPTSASPPPAFQEPPEPNVTGKGLDALIDSVKRRTGASPFLRGKHASLDPFGAPGGDRGVAPAAAPVYHPTFQAHVCWGGNADVLNGNAINERERKRRRSESDVPLPIRDGRLLDIKGELESSEEEGERFPLSDSRSEKERLGRKRTRTNPV